MKQTKKTLTKHIHKTHYETYKHTNKHTNTQHDKRTIETHKQHKQTRTTT